LQHREEHLKEQNKKSTYKTVVVADKPKELVDAEVADSVDLASILKQRMTELHMEIDKLKGNLGEFARGSDKSLTELSQNMALLRRNLEPV